MSNSDGLAGPLVRHREQSEYHSTVIEKPIEDVSREGELTKREKEGEKEDQARGSRSAELARYMSC